MRLTSIRLPLKKSITHDSEGFKKENIFWTESIPAGVRDCTDKETADKETVAAYQFGYDAEVIYEIDAALYKKQKFFQDDSDNTIYDIKRTVRRGNSYKIQLYVQARADGDGIPEVI